MQPQTATHPKLDFTLGGILKSSDFWSMIQIGINLSYLFITNIVQSKQLKQKLPYELIDIFISIILP